jgi:hypothetical protein
MTLRDPDELRTAIPEIGKRDNHRLLGRIHTRMVALAQDIDKTLDGLRRITR